MSDELDEISGATTKPLGSVYPDDAVLDETGDYTQVHIDLDENLNAVVLRFDGKASVRFGRRTLTMFAALVRASLDCLAPDEPDRDP